MEFHVNGGLTPCKHPTFHVKGSINKEKGALDLGARDATPSALPLVSFLPNNGSHATRAFRHLPGIGTESAGSSCEGARSLASVLEPCWCDGFGTTY